MEAKKYENNRCGYTSHFTKGQMAIARGETAICVWPVPQGEFASEKFSWILQENNKTDQLR